MLTPEQRLQFALIDLKRLASERQLLRGHFSLVAKRHAVKVKDLQKAYQS